jgi:hypothetical protein
VEPELADPANKESSVEFGSFFNLPHNCCAQPTPDQPKWEFFGSGRDALLAAVQHGREILGWRRVLLPTYYCEDIHRRLCGHIEIGFYPDSPVASTFKVEPDPRDVVVCVEYFGTPAHAIVAHGSFIIDRTHDPLSGHLYRRLPDYVFGSLRKCAPVADGGFLASPSGQSTPSAGTDSASHRVASTLMHEAMMLKGDFLRGQSVSKDTYLDLYRRGEATLGEGLPSAITRESRRILESFSLQHARACAHRNAACLRELLGDLPSNVSLVRAHSHFVLLGDSAEECDRICNRLIERGVFPARLWPLHEGTASADDHDLSRRLITMHVDFRYSVANMTLLASRIVESLTP